MILAYHQAILRSIGPILYTILNEGNSEAFFILMSIKLVDSMHSMSDTYPSNSVLHSINSEWLSVFMDYSAVGDHSVVKKIFSVWKEGSSVWQNFNINPNPYLIPYPKPPPPHSISNCNHNSVRGVNLFCLIRLKTILKLHWGFKNILHFILLGCKFLSFSNMNLNCSTPLTFFNRIFQRNPPSSADCCTILTWVFDPVSIASLAESCFENAPLNTSGSLTTVSAQ